MTMTAYKVLLKNKKTDKEFIHDINGKYPDQIKVRIQRNMADIQFMQILYSKEIDEVQHS